MEDKTISVNEQRIRKITSLYYSKPEVQKAIFEFSKNREICPRYFEGFGKRPDTFEYPGDIFELVKKGATSFHCSEELWREPLKIQTGMNEKQLNELRIGWDLCLPDFETIFIREDGNVKKITLKELAETLKLNNPGRFKLPKNFEVLSINSQTYKIEYDLIKDLIIRKKREGEKLIKISVEDGKEIFVSEDHPLLIFTKDGIKQKEAKRLSKNDYLLTPLKIDFPDSYAYFDIIEEIEKLKYDTNYKLKYKDSLISWILVEGENYHNKLSGSIKNFLSKSATPLNIYLLHEESKKNREKIKLRSRRSKLSIFPLIKLNNNFGKLIGYYLSEGSLDKSRLEFTFNKNEVKEGKEVVSLFNDVFGVKYDHEKSIVFHKLANSLKVRINSKLVSTLFKDIFGFKFKADKKKIPSWVYNAPDEFVAGLLEGYFIGDGCSIYEWNKKSIRIDALSASQELIEGLSTLCLKLGIHCNIIKYSRKNIIRVSGEEGVKKFISFCGNFIIKKKINFIPQKIKHPSKHTGYPPFLDKNLIKMVRNKTQQSNLYRAIRLNMRLNKDLILLAANKHLNKIIKNNLFPIKIKKIETEHYGGLFYDVETVNNHNFLHGSAIFTHNCLDIDSKYIDYSKIMTIEIIKILRFHGIKNIGVKFSGSKGLHILIPWKAFPKEINGIKTSDMFPEWPRILVRYIIEQTKDKLIEKISELERPNKYIKDYHASKEVMPDLILVSPRHLFRMPYSLHEKTALASIVLKPEEIEKFEMRDADPMKLSNSEIRNFMPNSKEGEASELLIQALDWYKDNSKDEIKKENDFKPIKLANISDAHFPPCIKNILKGLSDGKKRALFVLINLFRSVGMDKDELEKRIYDWNKKNETPLKEGYVKTQISWAYRKKPIMPSNCKEFYQGIGVCEPDSFCKLVKNPTNYVIRKNMSGNFEKKPKMKKEK